jgi:hypothetical protein
MNGVQHMTKNILLPLVLVGMIAAALSGCASDGQHRFNGTQVPSIVQQHGGGDPTPIY